MISSIFLPLVDKMTLFGSILFSVNRLKDETGITISVKDGNSAVIHLEGTKEGVEKAAELLMEQVDKMENEKEKDLIIEHRFHGNIIGAKGEKVREIRDMFNQVSFGIVCLMVWEIGFDG